MTPCKWNVNNSAVSHSGTRSSSAICSQPPSWADITERRSSSSSTIGAWPFMNFQPSAVTSIGISTAGFGEKGTGSSARTYDEKIVKKSKTHPAPTNIQSTEYSWNLLWRSESNDYSIEQEVEQPGPALKCLHFSQRANFSHFERRVEPFK